MRRLIVAALIAAAATLGLTAPSSAATVSLSVPSTVRLVSSCSEYSIRYNVPATYDWSLTITIKKPNGAIVDSSWLTQGLDPAAGAKKLQLCSTSMPAGRYIVAATYEGQNSNYETVATGSTSRWMNVAKSKSKTKLKTSRKTVRLGKNVRFRGVSRAAGERLQYGNVVLKVKAPGKKWRTLDKNMTSDTGVYSAQAEAASRRGLFKFRLCTKADDWYTGSCSKAVRVRTR